MLSNNDEQNNVLTIKTVQISPFRILMTALKDILLETNIVFTKEGTIKRGGDWLKNIMVYETQRMGNMKGPLNLYVWNEHFIRLILEYLSKENDKVIDPFAGSGVVPYIAKKMKRQYYGIELDKEVYDNSLFKRVAPFENLVGV